ncbi:hypothetical protein AJ80_08981 [Polytolypa hystricis UAMH7299]|uniref:CFEM domain-containing protein n=1 Tax=Polytolypa hystricis (strain UAMH7299) TaxID=1447883 RepID=A0A2B7WY71_POLH7|nr:hypothetical protein AJ80_08981 [Polytolypa hystricis UAMH7299]
MPLHLRHIVTTILLSVPSLFAQSTIIQRQETLKVDDEVPSCAKPCLDEFIASNYSINGCPDSNDLTCLCKAFTRSGLTLGEAALGCVVTYCPEPTNSQLAVYAVCSEVQGAQPNTFKTITAIVVSTTSTPVPSAPPSTTSVRFTITSSPTPSSTSPLPVATPTGTLAASQTYPMATTSAPGETSAAPEAASASSSGTQLTHIQIIGISIGSAFAGTFLLCLIAVLLVRRRRRRILDGEKNQFFEIGGEMSEPPLRPPSPLRDPVGYMVRTPIGTYNEPIIRRLTPGPKVRAPTSTLEVPLPGVGVVVPEDEAKDATNSPMGSPQSSRTVSELLPDKPTYDYAPQHPITQKLGLRPQSSMTIFEEDMDVRKSFVTPRGSRNLTPQYDVEPMPIGSGCVKFYDRDLHRQQGQQAGPLRMEAEQIQQYGQYLVPETRNQPRGITNSFPGDDSESRTKKLELGSPFHTPSEASSSFHPHPLNVLNGRHRGSDRDRDRRRESGRSIRSSVTSFESAGSDEELDDDHDVAPIRPTRRLSPVREFPTSSEYLPPPVKYNPAAYGSGPRSGSPKRHQSASGTHFPYRNPKAPSSSSTPPSRSFSQRQRPGRNGLPLQHTARQPSPLSVSSTQHSSRHRNHDRDSPHSRHRGISPYPPTDRMPSPDDGSTSSNTSTSSLLVKRRGERMADKLGSELKLQIPTSSRHRHPPPPPPAVAAPHDRDRNNNLLPPPPAPLQIPPKSPLRGNPIPSLHEAMQKPVPPPPPPPPPPEIYTSNHHRQKYYAGYHQRDSSGYDNGRKLTPTKRGHDLYLDVE